MSQTPCIRDRPTSQANPVKLPLTSPVARSVGTLTDAASEGQPRRTCWRSQFTANCNSQGSGLPSGQSRYVPPSEGPMKVSDLIGSRREVYSISEETSVHLGAQYLREKQVRSVGVLDSAGRLMGVVSQSDISDKVAAENKCPAWMKIGDIMSRNLISVNLDMTLEDCLERMEKHGVYHLLVMDGRNNFCGMVSVSDLLRVLATDNKERADLLQAFIDPVR